MKLAVFAKITSLATVSKVKDIVNVIRGNVAETATSPLPETMCWEGMVILYEAVSTVRPAVNTVSALIQVLHRVLTLDTTFALLVNGFRSQDVVQIGFS
jgi:hypothetical protein